MCTDIAATNSGHAISDASSDSATRSGSSGSSRSGYSAGSRGSGRFGVFHEDYHALCQRNKRQPLNFFKLDPRSSKYKLRLCADKISFVDWELVLGALRYDSTLSSISVLNRRVGILKLDNFDSVNTREKANKFDRVPVILTRYMMLKFVGAVAQCLSKTDVLSDLHLEGLPLRVDYVVLLCKGLYRNSSLSRLALPHCSLGDEGCGELCRALKNLPNIKILNLTACGITTAGIESVVELIKFQQLWRTGQCWEQGLRSQTLDPESISGLRRVTLNYNSVGDEGAIQLINSLADDNFIKAVDMQSCQLTEGIVPDLLELIEANNQLLVFDVRHNQVSDTAVRRIFGQFQKGRVPSHEWRWIRAEAGGVWRPCGRFSTFSHKAPRSTSSDGIAPEVSISVSADSSSRTQSALELTQSRVWSQMYVNDVEHCGSHDKTGAQCRVHDDPGAQCGSHDKTGAQCRVHDDPEVQCGSHDKTGAQCRVHDDPGARCGSHDKTGAQCRVHDDPGAQCGLENDPGAPHGLHNGTGTESPVNSGVTEQGLNSSASLQMALGRLLEFASAAESVVGPLESVSPIVVCQPCGCGSKSVSFDLEKGPAGGDGKEAAPRCNNHPDTDVDSLITLDRINAHAGRRSQTSLTNERLTGHGDVCPLHPNGFNSEATDQLAQTSLKDASHQPLPNSSRQSSGRVSLQTSLDECATQTLSDKGTVETERQTSLKSLMRWDANEKTGLFSGSDESILHAVFLGRKRTKRSVTDSSDSNCTVSSLSNESSLSNSTGSSSSSSSRYTGASAGAHSSRATFVRLLLKTHSLTSNSQPSNCNQVSQNVGNGKLLEAIS